MYSLRKQRGDLERKGVIVTQRRGGLGDAMGVSKLHCSKRDKIEGNDDATGSSTPRKSTERSQSNPCFSEVFLSFREGR